jgi:cobalamin-dependent methionine synthase I
MKFRWTCNCPRRWRPEDALHIDWCPFFQTWDLAGPFPAILRDEVVGAEAVRVFSDGKRLLQRLIEGRCLQAHGVVALLPANTVDDDTIEAFAGRLHHRVRTEFWGYAPDEALSNEDLIAEKYRGIRPAPGYPTCPDHRVKRPMFEVLKVAEIGMGLTESLAMTPAASVSGFYLAHRDARCFNVGRIGDDQMPDWAKRNGLDEGEARRALATVV